MTSEQRRHAAETHLQFLLSRIQTGELSVWSSSLTGTARTGYLLTVVAQTPKPDPLEAEFPGMGVSA